MPGCSDGAGSTSAPPDRRAPKEATANPNERAARSKWRCPVGRRRAEFRTRGDGMAHDPKDPRRLEESLGAARAEVARLKVEAAHMAAWAAAIAHEVNQPLSGIVTNAS